MTDTTIKPYVPDYGAEAERLKPVGLPDMHAAYRIVLPGVLQAQSCVCP